MDAPAIREELRDMARRFATSGYYVMLPNLYYRAGEMELGPIEFDPEGPWRKKMFALMDSLEIDMVLADVDAMIAFAAKDPAANSGSVGTIGYCMSGRFAVCAGGSPGTRRLDCPHTWMRAPSSAGSTPATRTCTRTSSPVTGAVMTRSTPRIG